MPITYHELMALREQVADDDPDTLRRLEEALREFHAEAAKSGRRHFTVPHYVGFEQR